MILPRITLPAPGSGTGLVTATDLNSRLGTAVQPIRPLAGGRIAVRIDGQFKSVSLSWANVQHV